MKSGIILLDIFRDFPSSSKKFDFPLRNICTFKTGGPAALLLSPSSAGEIARATELCRRHLIRYCVLGGGSNVLISDKGFDGVILHIGKNFSGCSVDGDFVRAEAGVRLIALSKIAEKAGLAGLEFCSGIPGTLGGGILMNAGAYGGEMSFVTDSVTVLDGYRQVKLDRDSCGFSYRRSIFDDSECIITGAVLRLKKDAPEAIRARTEEYTIKRRTNTPWDQPSAGSVFKRPKNDFAARLIEEAGLKGAKIGGAEVSTVHSGFIVNTGGASSADIYKLTEFVRETVYRKFGITLETEIKFLGEF